jgi:undecaprenol kinase
MMNPRLLLRSFRHALHGVALAFRTEQSFRVQALVALVVVSLGLWLGVSRTEWVVLLLLIALVLVLELINSVFERLTDAFKPRLHPIVHEVKDLMAGTVLIGAVLSAVVGLMIFLPRLAALFP